MAIVNNGTRVSIPSQLIADDFVAPAVTTFSDEEYVRNITLNVLKATVENAAKDVTLDNLIDNVTIGIEKQVEDIITADYIGSNTVTFWIDWLTLRSNIAASKSTDFLNDTAVSYVVNVDVYIKTA